MTVSHVKPKYTVESVAQHLAEDLIQHSVTLSHTEYNVGWKECLRTIRGSMKALADGCNAGIDTEIAYQVHRIVRRAMTPHQPELMCSLGSGPDIECGLCGQTIKHIIHTSAQGG